MRRGARRRRGEPDLRAGDRVFGMARTRGSYAEHTAVEPGAQAEAVAAVTDGVTDEQAAALPIPAITALGSRDLLQTSMGQRLVVMGGAGAVGGYARADGALSGRTRHRDGSRRHRRGTPARRRRDCAAQLLETLRRGGLRGKAIIRL